jgi:radical SAM superfamily enzyme YgiQ (UPF0313 family)
VLVGPIQQENLALQYLAASARRAGHSADVIAYSYRSDLDEAVRGVLERKPDLLGLGIAFQNNIEDYLAFMREVRRRGFAGHLTCGGHVPTFCHRELLRDVPELDTVVRHDGEETLVAVLDALGRGESPRDIAGLVWRDGTQVAVGAVRPGVADLDRLPPPDRSPQPYVVGGVTVDFVITARGCVGECNYCSIAAYTDEQRTRFRLRKPEPVAEEIADLYHRRGVRVVFVQDDLFILPSERKTIERMDRIRAGLSARGVGDVVFWIKGRPETITPAVAHAARAMGAIHMFLGVESASPVRLDYLGRTHEPEHNEAAIAHCREAGITPSFNFMLFDPDCSIDDLDATLDMADRNLDLPWNVCRTEVYSGTRLRDRLESEGRLEGDYRSFGYLMRDKRAEVLFRIVRVCLHERALAIESLLNRLISLSFARQLHEHFFPDSSTDKLASSIRELSLTARRDTIALLRELVGFVRTEDVCDKERVRKFAVSQALAVNARDRTLCHETERLWRHLNARGRLLSAKRGFLAPTAVRGGWGVAAGS